MADNKFSNLTARIYQGYDPNTEFKESGNLFSAARFADGAMKSGENFLSDIKSPAANTGPYLQNPFSNSGYQTENQENPFLPNAPNSFGGSSMSTPNANFDPLSQSSPGSQDNTGFQGTAPQGGQSNSSPSGNSFNAVSDPGPGAPPAPQAAPEQANPQLQAPVVTAQGSVTHEGDPINLIISVTADPQPGVMTAIILSGIPTDATLSAGVHNQDGTWTLTPAQLAGLILTPDPHSSGQITLSAVAVSTLGDLYATGTGNFILTIEENITSPGNIALNPVSGAEDMPVQLNIAASLNAEVPGIVAVTISNVPSGAVFSAGTDHHDGSWSFTPSQLANLALTPPVNYSGDLSLTVSVDANNNGTVSSVSGPLDVSIMGIADRPILAVAPASGDENTHIDLSISAALTDTDGSETLSIMIFNVPTGATLSAGTQNSDGSWTLTPAQAGNLQLIPPANFSGTITLDVVAASHEGNTNAYTDSTLTITVNQIVGAPVLTTSPASGNEDTSISLNISSSIPNGGTGVLSVLVSGVPTGATLSAGTDNHNGSWTLTSAQLTGLKINPPLNYSGDFNLTVTATATDNGVHGDTIATLPVHVAGVPDLPALSVQTSSGEENTAIHLNIAAALTDTDGSETLSVTIAGVPSGAALSAGTNNGNGSWTLTPAQLTNLTITPPHSYSGNFNLSVTASSFENGQYATTAASALNVTVGGVADTPTLSVTPSSGNEDTAITLNINAALTDTDGSETLSIRISGVPTGATLSAGTNNGNGNWTLTPSQLTNLSLSPPLNYSGIISLNVTAISSENGTTAQVTSPLAITVNGVADAPTLTVQNTSGNEDTAIAFNIGAALTDTDGSETLSIRIAGVPTGAALSAGTSTGGGNWTLTAAQLANLKVTPPLNYSGSFDLSVTAISSENGTTAQATGSIHVTVSGVADVPLLNVAPVSGNEDTAIALNIGAALTDTDGSETLSVQVSGVPTGATLSAGTNSGNGSWTLTSAQLANLTLTPPANYSGNFILGVTATSFENGTTAQATASLTVKVIAVADTPTLTVQAAAGNEDTAIALNIGAALTDTDGSEHLSVVIANMPAGATLSAGLNNGNGSWTLTSAQLANLTLIPADNFSGAINLQVSAVSTESNGEIATRTLPLSVTVAPIVDTPSLTVGAATGREDTAIALNINSALIDTDGSESLSIKISGVPNGATLSAGTSTGGGNWTLTSAQLAGLKITPPLNSSADFILNVSATSTESNGTTSTITAPLQVTVLGSADIPTVAAINTTGAKNTAVAVNISGAVTDNDGSESVTYLVSSVPDGFSFNHGTNNGNNTWTLTPSDLSGLKIVSPYNFDGRVYMSVRSVSHDDDGSVMQSLPANFNVGIGSASAGVQLNLALGLGTGGIGVGTALGADVNTGGLLTPGGIVVHEDSVFPFADAGLLLTLASGISFLNFSGLPVGASLNNGTDMGNGTWKVLPGGLANLSLTLPANSDQDFTMTVTAKLAVVTVQLALVDVHVLGVADLPTLSVANATGTEDAAGIHINVTSALTDTDGSETLSFMVKDLPTGFAPTVGIDNGNGTWSLTAAQISQLDIKPAANFSGDVNFTITAVSTEREGDSTAVSTTGHIHINPAADAPVVTPPVHTGTEDVALPLNLGVALTDTDGSESISAVTISGLATGFSLTGATNNGNGTWSVDPAQIGNVKLVSPTHWSGDTSFSVTATSREGASGPTASTTTTLQAHIDAVAQAPVLTVHDATGIEHNPIALNVSSALVDTDGSEHLSVVISHVPDHFAFSSGLNNGDGSWSFTQSQLSNLTVTSGDFSGDAHFSVDAFAQENSNHAVASTHADLTLHVTADT